jgi:hypothetical protein
MMKFDEMEMELKYWGLSSSHVCGRGAFNLPCLLILLVRKKYPQMLTRAKQPEITSGVVLLFLLLNPETLTTTSTKPLNAICEQEASSTTTFSSIYILEPIVLTR